MQFILPFAICGIQHIIQHVLHFFLKKAWCESFGCAKIRGFKFSRKAVTLSLGYIIRYVYVLEYAYTWDKKKAAA